MNLLTSPLSKEEPLSGREARGGVWPGCLERVKTGINWRSGPVSNKGGDGGVVGREPGL